MKIKLTNLRVIDRETGKVVLRADEAELDEWPFDVVEDGIKAIGIVGEEKGKCTEEEWRKAVDLH